MFSLGSVLRCADKSFRRKRTQTCGITAINVGVSVNALTTVQQHPTTSRRLSHPTGHPHGTAHPKAGTSSWASSLLHFYLGVDTALPAQPSDSLATNPFLLFIICSDWPISTKSNWIYVVFENLWFPVKKRNPSWVLFLLISWDGLIHSQMPSHEKYLYFKFSLFIFLSR